MEKNSSIAVIATNAETIAISQVGPHQIAATTRGIRIAAVSTRKPVPEFIRSFRFFDWPPGNWNQHIVTGSRVIHCVREHRVPPLPGLIPSWIARISHRFRGGLRSAVPSGLH